VVSNIDELKDKLPEADAEVPGLLPGVDRTVGGYEGLIAAQQCLPNNETRRQVRRRIQRAGQDLGGAVARSVLSPYEKDYRWLTQVYESVKPSSGNGKLLWHALGAKTIELIHENVHVDAVRDDLDTLVLDADLLEAVLSDPDPKKAKEIEIKLVAPAAQAPGQSRASRLSASGWRR
jgi:type I restriction enzyme, R subunit